MVIDLAWAPTAALILTLPARQRACENLLYLKFNILLNKIYTMMKKKQYKKSSNERACTHTNIKSKKGLTETRTHINEKQILMPY